MGKETQSVLMDASDIILSKELECLLEQFAENVNADISFLQEALKIILKNGYRIERKLPVSSRPSELLIDDLAAKLRDHNLIPIIGTGAYKVNIDGFGGSVTKYVAWTLLNRVKPILGISETVIDEICSHSDNELQCMSMVEALFGYGSSSYRTQIIRLFDDSEFVSHIRIRPEIETFLKICSPSLVISTSYFSHELSRLFPNYSIVSYQRNSRDDILLDSSYESIQHPTVYYLFGRACSSLSKFVSTERDFLDYLHCLNDSNTRPSVLLTDYLSKKQILTLGCEIPDWTFRFLIYSLKSESVRNPAGNMNEFSGGAIQDCFEQESHNFLSTIRYYIDSDMSGFLKLINDAVQGTVPSPKKLFLSYSSVKGSEDYRTIIRLKTALESVFDVWFFPERDAATPSGDYWAKIESALMECDYFMPVVTNYLVNRIKDEQLAQNQFSAEQDMRDNEPGFITEWRMAVAARRKKTDADPTAKYSIPYLIDVPETEVKKFANGILSFAKDLFYPPRGCTFALHNSFDVESFYKSLTNCQL